MKNVITVNFRNNGSVDLVSRINSGDNQLILHIINGLGARININGDVSTATTDDYYQELPSESWVGSGDLTFQVFDNDVSYNFTIHKLSLLQGDVFINMISAYEYQLLSSINDQYDYNGLNNKPKINGVTLIDNKSAEDLGLANKDDIKVKDVEVDDSSVVDENRVAKINLSSYALKSMLNAYQKLLRAGDNITLTENADGSFTISSSGGGGGGSVVEIVPTLATGTKIADYSIDGDTGALYAPNEAPTHQYSNSLKTVGTWFNDEPVYEFSYYGEGDPLSTSIDLITGLDMPTGKTVADIRIIQADVMYKDSTSDNYWYPMVYYASSNSYVTYSLIGNTTDAYGRIYKIRMAITKPSSKSVRKLCATIRYYFA